MYPKNWKQISKYVIHELYFNECANCGYIGGSRISSKGNKIFNVCSHKDHNKANCNIVNLECLCPSCHGKYSTNFHLSQKAPTAEDKKVFILRNR
jgi:hypothetical protein